MKRTGTHVNPVDPAREKIKGECSAHGGDRSDGIARERDQLSARMQQFYGISKDAADTHLDAFANRTGEYAGDHEAG